MVQITAMANSRKDALAHIQSCQSPLGDLIAQIYLYGDSQVLSHWKKELRSVLVVVERNIEVKGGKLLKQSAIVDALDQLALGSAIRLHYRDLIDHPDYQDLRKRRDSMYTSAQVQQLLSRLAMLVLDQVHTSWEIAQDLIDLILSW